MTTDSQIDERNAQKKAFEQGILIAEWLGKRGWNGASLLNTDLTITFTDEASKLVISKTFYEDYDGWDNRTVYTKQSLQIRSGGELVFESSQKTPGAGRPQEIEVKAYLSGAWEKALQPLYSEAAKALKADQKQNARDEKLVQEARGAAVRIAQRKQRVGYTPN